MFAVNDDLSIYLTRGDAASIPLPITHSFKANDIVRFQVFKKKDCAEVVLRKDFVIEEATQNFTIELDGTETKLVDIINKPTDFWYEVEVNPGANSETVIGYDDDGPKILTLFPEGSDGIITYEEFVTSAYTIAREHGFEGTKEEWLESLKGKPGDRGEKGESAYDIAVKLGYKGTEKEWIAYLEKAQTGDIDRKLQDAVYELSYLNTTFQTSLEDHYTAIDLELSSIRDNSIKEIERACDDKMDKILLAANIVQTTGDSETETMSQKAVTEELNAVYDTFLDGDPIEEFLEISLELSDGLITPSGMPTSNPKAEGSTARDVHSQRIEVQTGDVLVPRCDNADHEDITHYFEYVTAYDYYGRLVSRSGSLRCDSYTVPGGVGSVIVSLEEDSCLLQVGITRRAVNVKGVKRLEAEKLDRAEAAKELTKYSNALKGKASGEAIAITDVSPIEHEMNVSVRSKNILDLSSIKGSIVTGNGATMTCEEDGGIALEGTPSGAMSLPMFYVPLDETKQYTLSAHGDFTNASLVILLMDNNGFIRNSSGNPIGLTVSQSTKTKSIDLTNYPGVIKARCEVKLSNTNVDLRGTAYFQLEEGSTATAYVPYMEDFSTVRISKYGKNLYNSISDGQNRGISFTRQEDGTYHAYGTYIGDGVASARLELDTITLPKGKYTVSGCPKGGSQSSYYMIFGEIGLGENVVDYGDGAELELTARKTISVIMYVHPSVKTPDLIFKPMIEVGTGDKVYEPFGTPIFYAPDSYGQIRASSTYPTTSLLTDTEGAVIDCTYNRDINKAFEELTTKIIAISEAIL